MQPNATKITIYTICNNKDSYLNAWNYKSFTAYNFFYKCARDLISLQVDQKYELINENDKFWKSSHN